VSFFIHYDPNNYGTFLEGFVLSALPQPIDVSPDFATIGISKGISISGKSFLRISNVYLSGNPYVSACQTYNPFLSVYSMSATYPALFAFKLPASAINILSDHQIMLTIPAPSATGRFDIIVENLAGYGKLTQFCRHFGDYQPDYAQGIPVFIDNSEPISHP